MLHTWMPQVCCQERCYLHRLFKIAVKISYGAVFPGRIPECCRTISVVDMAASIRFIIIRPFIINGSFPCRPPRPDATIILIIIALDVQLPVRTLPDKLPGVFINLNLWYIAFICITYFYNTYYKLAIADILDYLAGVSIHHTVPTPGMRLHHKLMFTTRANSLVPMFYAR